ncbi:MAG: hypothetical protein EPO57_00415 [Chitinophagaceae bacterium]|nr:MAG: hypothetical protein EPO57_00415 [Chitinophagaceae bacterium]
MYNFELSIKNDYQIRYRIVGRVIITVNFFTTLWMLFAKSSDKILLIVLTVLPILFFSLTKKTTPKKLLIALILLTAIVWLTYGIYWLASINLLFIFLVFWATKELKIIIAKTEITYPSFPVKIISWIEVDNVILKDGLLTIDLKNNKILQSEILETKNGFSINENDFNQFCKEQITH